MTTRLSLVCPPCGQVIEADSQDQLVELATAHAKTKHGATVGRAEILKRAQAGPMSAGRAILPHPLHSHTTLESTDIEKSVRFYREVLGLSTARQLDSVGLLHASNGHIAAIIELPKVTPQPYWNYYARAW